MAVYENVNKSKKQIMEDAIVIAYALLAIQGRKEDEVSENEAFSTYGKSWLKDRTSRGMLNFTRSGSTPLSAKVYSRFEIESLKLAEKRITEQYKRAKALADSFQSKIEADK